MQVESERKWREKTTPTPAPFHLSSGSTFMTYFLCTGEHFHLDKDKTETDTKISRHCILHRVEACISFMAWKKKKRRKKRAAPTGLHHISQRRKTFRRSTERKTPRGAQTYTRYERRKVYPPSNVQWAPSPKRLQDCQLSSDTCLCERLGTKC